jgi:hypothetical protein
VNATMTFPIITLHRGYNIKTIKLTTYGKRIEQRTCFIKT